MKKRTVLTTLFGVMLASCLVLALLAVVILSTTLFAFDNFTLSRGETVERNVIVFGYNGTFEEGSRVNGSVITLGGNLQIFGDIDGNVVVAGGNLMVLDSASIGGSTYAIGGNVRNISAP